ncbi:MULTISPECIES: type VI secretion system Vgr family protein [Aquimarina]|uniref:type VI secretion system Vgr family protein n=1 Tax=Aquimarina TaxID=290174 RepID=UPI00042A0DD4|nr:MULTISPECIES: phage baseplate assembly protein V [Aquimarina]
MALQTTTQIFISGTPIQSYVSLKLVQEIDAHHDLELVCRTDVVEKLSEELIGDSKEYLGGVITMKISSTSDFGIYKELEFKGVVTKVVGTKGFHQSSGDLVTLEAKSTSILSDDGGHYASFNDISLSEILEQTFQEYDKGKLETNFSPVSSDTIHYSVQHNQSAFSYASRLAAYHNEWFYYDGKKLIFGSPSDEETELSYGVDLQKFSLELSSIANSFDYFTNDYLMDEVHQKSSTQVAIPSEGYHGFTDKISKELFSKQTQVYHNLYNDASIKPRLDTQVEQYTKARAMQQVIAKGSSDNPGVNLGEVIKIKGHGTFRIIKITHTNIEGGSYKNTFEAVDANFIAYPKMDINRYPKSDVQIATVMENNDPEGLSRIKVQFPWQKPLGATTPWLRMMTPHAGSDKGFHFIPEIDEEVIVNFEGGNAERPFVLGALYHGTAKPDSWQSDNNDIKAIKTRTGHLIELNDTEGSESIKITDKNDNIVHIDTVNNNITVTALEKMTFNATNFELNVKENAIFNIGKNTEIHTGENLDVSSKNANEIIESEKHIQIGGSLTQLSAETEIQSDGDLKISGGGTASFNGGSDVKISKG